jgi:hypothetical protein
MIEAETSLSNNIDITNVTIQGEGGLQKVSVFKSSSLTFSSGGTANLTRLAFDLKSNTNAFSFIIANCNELSTSTLTVTSCTFNYYQKLNAALIYVTGMSSLEIGNVNITRNLSSKTRNTLANADDNICSITTNYPSILLTNSKAKISTSTFSNIQTGVIIVHGGELNLTSVTFINNVITTRTGFSDLRHNVFVSNNAKVIVSDLQPDTGKSNFIYVSELLGGAVQGVDAPLFVPTITSALPPTLSPELNTTFLFSGTMLFPCGLQLYVYRDSETNLKVQGMEVSIPEQTTVSAVLDNSLFDEPGTYYAYLTYGPNYSFRTDSVALLQDYSNIEELKKKELSVGGIVGIVIGVVIAVLAIITIVIVVVVFLLWRRKRKIRETTESGAERIPGSSQSMINTKITSLDDAGEVDVDDSFDSVSTRQPSVNDEWFVGESGKKTTTTRASVHGSSEDEGKEDSF